MIAGRIGSDDDTHTGVEGLRRKICTRDPRAAYSQRHSEKSEARSQKERRNEEPRGSAFCGATRSGAQRGDSRVGRGFTSVPWGGNPLGQHSGRNRY